jgi:hypothetical protein
MSGGQDITTEDFSVGEHPGFCAEKDNNPVEHPSHYNQGSIEVIDFIEDQAHLGWCRLNAVKYICRSGVKKSESKEQSIRKAIWYLERELGMHKSERL